MTYPTMNTFSKRKGQLVALRTNGRLRPLFAVALCCCSTLFALLLAEGIIRLVSPQAVQVPYHDELNGILAARPNVRGRFAVADTFDTTISVNSERFRGQKEYSEQPQAGVLRIVTLGDSLTFGFGANDDQTYPAQLERDLNQSLQGTEEHTKVEVINSSISGAGTGDEALLFATWAARFHPDLVILNVYANDVDDDHDRKMFDIEAKGDAVPRQGKELASAGAPARRIRSLVNSIPLYSFLAEHSHLLYLVRHACTLAVEKVRAAKFQTGTGDRGMAYSSRTGFVNEGIPMLNAEIRWLHAQVRRSGARLIVTYLPPQWWKPGAPPGYRWKSEVIVKALGELSVNDAIPFLDLTPVVRTREGQLGKSLYYQRRDEHPNPIGYQVFAESIAGYLLSQHLITPRPPVLRAGTH